MPYTSPPPRFAGLQKLLSLQPGEARPVALFSVYSLLMGAAVAVFYTCSTTLFLASFERSQLPLAFVAGGGVIYTLGTAVQRLQRRLTFVQVNAGLMLFTLFTVGALLLVSNLAHTKWVYFVLFLWNRGFVFVHGVVFWATMGRVFNLQQSKRLFSLIGLGDVVSSIISYLSVPLLLKLFSPDQLLLVAYGFLILCTLLMAYIRRQYQAVLSVARKPAAPAPAAGGLAKSAGRSYYSLLFLLSLLAVFGLIYVDYMFTVLSKEVYPNKESMASFLGLFFGISAVIELFVKGFLYNKLISTYSIRIGIVLLPLLLIFSFTLAALYGTAYGVTPIFFAFIALSRFFMSAIRRSISDPAFQVLFQPIPAAERTLLQSRIEGGPKALGPALTGVLLLVLYALGLHSMVELSYVFLLVLVFWAVTSFRIQAEYRTMLSEAIARSAELIHRATPRAARPPAAQGPEAVEEQDGEPARPVLFEELSQLMLSPDEAHRVRAALGFGHSGRFYAYRHLLVLLDDPAPAVREAAIRSAGSLRKPELWPRLLDYLRLDRHPAAVVAALLQIGEGIVPALGKLFNQPGLPPARQAAIAGVVGKIAGENGRRFLRANLTHPHPRVRDQVLLGLGRLHYQATSTERPHLMRQLDEQIERLVWLAATRLDLQKTYSRASPLLRAVSHEKDQMVAKVFNLLSLLYGSNKFDVLSELVTRKNQEVQGFLLELLSNILPLEVKDRVLPLFGNTPLAEMVRKSAANYPQQRLGAEARLHDFINRDYAQLTPWVKAAAIRELLTHHQTDPTVVLVANAVSPEAILAETALFVLYRLNPTRFAGLYQALSAHPDSLCYHLATAVQAGLPEEELQLSGYLALLPAPAEPAEA